MLFQIPPNKPPVRIDGATNYEQAAMKSLEAMVALAETRVSAHACKKLITVSTPTTEVA